MWQDAMLYVPSQDSAGFHFAFDTWERGFSLGAGPEIEDSQASHSDPQLALVALVNCAASCV